MKHKDTNAFLHSHDLHYPLRYEDGRVSSTGQQVTGVMESSDNCFWRIKPTIPIENNGEPVPVRNGDIVQLEHVVTGTNLLTHDVASPWMPTNEEITTVPLNTRYEETLFKIVFEDEDDNILETHMTPFRLIHEDTKVAVWAHNKKLPEWGLGHLEVNGNKNAIDSTNYWVAQEIKGKNATEINSKKNEKQLGHMPFIKKFIELQSIMFADVLARRRGIEPIDEPVRHRLLQSAGFFFTAWALHYLPFFFMGRSLFLHHYLPAATLNYLLLGAMYQFIFIDGIDSPVSFVTRQSRTLRFMTMKAEIPKKVYAIVLVTLLFQIGMFVFLAPLTYGLPMSLDEVRSHQILGGWKLQYAK
ncbi:hypothetical protein RO3G_02309 [Rhizopus delemar RA 99-880]|uniref:Dolichyl-phosphate-mannose--protein mannosyltransferase n=1 Tax=Rhizopus delemar (strain RA 99-880 / ATCC MYA-4621 / FGSC 9543 / NRRL 43880) TaxID=246409 RepID=I1BN25_RHIO9|nr:hypothetical protein RO3G_02309 [Rhizopus delemar RA 99-880]|eukprot:EIE77605.1 hypothetical protein RO3G_02309 [Rhizopus delemar RA 99-880]